MDALWKTAVLGALIQFCAVVGHCAPATESLYPKTNLMTLLAQWKPLPDTVGTICELKPEWVGTVERVYLRDPKGIYNEEAAEHIRFLHLMVSHTNMSILRGRLMANGKHGSFRGSEAPVFTSNLPSAKAVWEAKNVDELKKMFGPQHGWTDGWGGPNGMHWTEGWTWFTAEATNRLRYLSVFAHVSSADREKPADIDIIRICEGFFRPANPNSAEERVQFKTGAEINANYEKRRASDREHYPLQLRALVEARETPDDSDLLAYKRALNEVRKNPSPKLFGQFAEWIHEGTVEIRLMLETILFDGFLKLEKWEEPQRRIALRALTDALPRVKTAMDLDNMVVFLLRAQGGGHLRVPVPGTKGVIDIKADTSGGSTFGSNISAKDLVHAAKECQRALRKRYPELE